MARLDAVRRNPRTVFNLCSRVAQLVARCSAYLAWLLSVFPSWPRVARRRRRRARPRPPCRRRPVHPPRRQRRPLWRQRNRLPPGPRQPPVRPLARWRHLRLARQWSWAECGYPRMCRSPALSRTLRARPTARLTTATRRIPPHRRNRSPRRLATAATSTS